MEESLRSRRLPVTEALPARAWRRPRLRTGGFIALSGLSILALLLTIWGFLIEPGLLLVRHASIETAKWPSALPPLRIRAVAAIHAGAPHIAPAKLGHIVPEVNAQHPDVGRRLGDYV